MLKKHIDARSQAVSSDVDVSCIFVLMPAQSGALIGDLESPLSLGLTDGAMLCAIAADQCHAQSA